MMRKIVNIRTILSLIFMLALFSCEYTQEVEDPISPDGYPVATFQTDFAGNTVTEGDTINYTISIDKWLDRSLTFTVTVLDGTADENDFTFEEVTIAAYSSEAEMQIIFAADDNPEVAETITLEVGIVDIGRKYLVNPSTVNPVLDLTINNYNDESALTIGFGWVNHDDDIDLFSVYDDVNGWFPDYDPDGDGLVSWDAAASSDNPEILKNYTDDPPGSYYLAIDPFYVTGSTVDYTISLGYPDQSVNFINGVFDMNALDTYPTVYFDAWDFYPYHLFTVEVMNDGTFTVTHLNE